MTECMFERRLACSEKPVPKELNRLARVVEDCIEDQWVLTGAQAEVLCKSLRQISKRLIRESVA